MMSVFIIHSKFINYGYFCVISKSSMEDYNDNFGFLKIICLFGHDPYMNDGRKKTM
jgi:hypothetical protein